MTGARLWDWEQRLADYLAGVAADVDALGPMPCARFAFDAAQAQTSVDSYAPYRGKYKTEIGGAKLMRKHGDGTLPSIFDLHYTQKEAAFAQRGDLIFNGETMGVCIGGMAVFIHGDTLVQLPRAYWEKVWAVG